MRFENGGFNASKEGSPKIEGYEEMPIKKRILSFLGSGLLEKVSEIKEEGFSNEILQSPEIKKAAKDKMISYIKRESFDKALEIREIFDLSQGDMKSFEIQDAFEEKIIAYMEKGDPDKAWKVIDTFDISGKNVDGGRRQEVAVKGVQTLLERASTDKDIIDKIIRINDIFQLPQSFLLASVLEPDARKAFNYYIQKGDMDDADRIMGMFGLSKSVVQPSEVREISRQYFISDVIKHRDASDIVEFLKTYEISDDIVHSPEVMGAAKKRIMTSTERGDLQDAKDIRKIFGLSENS